jgi:hypothetical protein
MKTAKEYIEEYGYCDGDQFGVKEVSEIINSARKEIIEECAKRAKAVLIPSNPFQDRYSAISNQQGFSVDKQSILSLINELK